jgi:hypothetical protein
MVLRLWRRWTGGYNHVSINYDEEKAICEGGVVDECSECVICWEKFSATHYPTIVCSQGHQCCVQCVAKQTQCHTCREVRSFDPIINRALCSALQIEPQIPPSSRTATAISQCVGRLKSLFEQKVCSVRKAYWDDMEKNVSVYAKDILLKGKASFTDGGKFLSQRPVLTTQDAIELTAKTLSVDPSRLHVTEKDEKGGPYLVLRDYRTYQSDMMRRV